MLHALKHKKNGHDIYFALKLDMNKAYDRIRLDLHSWWVSTVMTCVKSVSYSIVVNGNVRETFKPKRGLRQGDLLSVGNLALKLCNMAFWGIKISEID